MLHWSGGRRGGCRGWATRLGRVGIADGLWLEIDADVGVFEGIVWGANDDCTVKAACTVRKP